jgi:predicted Rossmann-fold nucleotide-binding protein
VNTHGFYDDLQRFLLKTIDEKMMNREHAEMWSLVDAPDDVLPRIRATPAWREDARAIASVRG